MKNVVGRISGKIRVSLFLSLFLNWVPTEALSHPKEIDSSNQWIPVPILVAGRGVIGSSFSLFLQKILNRAPGLDSKSVHLISPDDGFRATPLSAGTFYPPGMVLKTPVHHPSYVQHALSIRTAQFYHWLQANGNDIGMRIGGSIEIATHQSELEYLRKQEALLEKIYPENRLITHSHKIAEMDSRLNLNRIKGIFFMPFSGYLDGASLNYVLEERAKEEGATVLNDKIVSVHVTSAVQSNRFGLSSLMLQDENFYFDSPRLNDRFQYEVRTQSGKNYLTPILVLATGEETPRLASAFHFEENEELKSMKLQIEGESVKAHVTQLRPLKTKTFDSTENGYFRIWMSASLHSSGEKYTLDPETEERKYFHWYTRPISAEDQAGDILIGGDRIRSQPGDLQMREKNRKEILSHFESLVSGYDIADASQTYVCRMPASNSKDGRPIVGAIDEKRLPGLLVAAGFGPRGIQHGPGAMLEFATMVANQYFGVPIEWDRYVMTCLDPGRAGAGLGLVAK